MTDQGTKPATRSTYRHGDLRRALLEAGIALAQAGGPDAIVLREATRRAGVVPNAAYRHFASRLELVRAVRIAALESSRRLADLRHPKIESKYLRQMRFYREADDEDLFAVGFADVQLTEMDAPGHPRSRVICAHCGEGVNDGREVDSQDGTTLCRPCGFAAGHQSKTLSFERTLTHTA